jgi:hypothetical protein
MSSLLLGVVFSYNPFCINLPATSANFSQSGPCCVLLQALEAELASSAAAAQQLQADLLAKDVEGSILRQQLTAAAQQLQQLSQQLSAAQGRSSEEVSQVKGQLLVVIEVAAVF